MAAVYLFEATPRVAATGATTTVRLAGGGSRPYYGYRGQNDWLSGLAGPPRFTTEIGFDDTGWTGGAIPQTANIPFAPNSIARAQALCAYYWKGARVTIYTADDAAGPPAAWSVLMTGTMAGEPGLSDGILNFVMSDLSGDLAKPIAPNTFAGTGGLEGPVEIAGRLKRRSWGRVFNVEGRILDKVNSIYEFGDPAQPLQSFDMIKDKGRSGPMTVLAWQGTVLATFAALQAAAAPQGGAVVAPSIACAKWWTTPSGPLTADLRGEVGSGYVETAIGIAARVVAAVSTISTGFTINASRSYVVGVHCDTVGETAQQILDRLFLGCGLVWTLDPSGVVTINEFKWTGSVETITSHNVTRDAGFVTLKNRRLGYQRNYRVHSASEISAALTDNPASGPNQVKFSQFEAGANGWAVTDPGHITTGSLTPTTVGGISSGKQTFTATAAAQTFTIGQDPAYRFPVTPGTNLATLLAIEATGPIATSQGIITWYDASGVAFSPTTIATIAGAAAFNSPMRLHVTVPTGAVTAGLSLIITTSGAGAGSASLVQPMIAPMPEGSTNYPPFVAGPNSYDAGDVTANSQVTMTSTNAKTIPADSTGVIASGTLPSTVAAPKVVLGGNDVTQSDIPQYAIVNTTGGCVGNVTVDTANGSFTKGVQTVGTGFNASGSYQLKVTVNGKDQPLITVNVTKKLADPPSGGGGGGGGGSTSANMSTGGYAALSGTFTAVGQVLANITVASGKTASLSGGDDYSVLGGSGLLGNVTLEVKWQYSPTGANTWTDVGSSSVGSAATYNQKTGDESTGSVSCARTVSPAAGSYDFRLVARISSGSSGASGQFVGSGLWGVNVA